MENLFAKDSIRTFTGIYMNVFDPAPEMICIEDIAHALSMQPRFGGHLPVFYSVAEHSWNCGLHILNEEQKLAALLHDASEAYLLDVPRPIKGKLTNYKEIEDNLMRLISQKFGFQYPLCQSVKDIDNIMLQKEWDEIMLGSGTYVPFSQQRAKENFLSAFKRYSA